MNAIDPIHWAILLLTLGCLLVVMEVFFPSGGLLSVASAAAFGAAIFIAFYYHGPKTGLSLMLFSMIAVPILVVVAFKFWPKTPMGRAFLGELPSEAEVSPSDPRRKLVGKVGIARTKMLPSGAVEVEGQWVDAVTQGMAIDPGQNVVVVEVRGNRVVVRPANDDEEPSRDEGDLLSRPIDELGLESIDDPLA